MKELIKISSPGDIWMAMFKYARKRQEHIWLITLNGAHEVIKVHLITKGLVNKCIIHPREFFYPAIKDYASSVVMVHNHPSGNALPSKEDENITDDLQKAALILGFNFVDHVIISKNGWYSMRQEGDIDSDKTYSRGEMEDFILKVAQNR